MPDKACREIDVRTERGSTRYSGLTVDVDNPRHIRLMRAEGAFPSNLGGTPVVDGFPCRCCGFASFFLRCSRCGADNPRIEE